MKTSMKKIIVICGMVLIGVTNTAIAYTTYNGGLAEESEWQLDAGVTLLEDFESYSIGTQISELPSLGVSFDTLDGGGYPHIYRHGSTTTPYGNYHLGNFPNGINSINRWDDIIMRVLPGYEITAFGYWNGDGQSDTLIATAYDYSDNIIGSVGAFKGTFAGFISDVAISYVVFDGDTGDGWNHLDGLQTNVVPVPAAIWLLSTGLLGLVGLRRKMR
jgi:hypothetical protein